MSNQDRAIVNVVSGTVTTPTAGFSTFMILGEHDRFAERSRVYAGSSTAILEAMKADNFLETDQEYVAVRALVTQTIPVSSVVVGRRAMGTKQVDTLTVDTATDDTDYTFGIAHADGGYVNDVTVNSGTGSTVTSIRDALKAAIVSAQFPFSLADDGADALTLSSTTTMPFTLTPGANLSVASVTAHAASGEPVTAALDAVNDENNSWYGCALVSPLAADNILLSTWAVGKGKFPILFSSQNNVANDVGEHMFKTENVLARDFLMAFTYRFWEYKHIAWHGPRLAINPDDGSTSWSTDRLVGVTFEPLNATQKFNIEKYNGVFFDRAGGAVVSMTHAKLASGEWPDVQLTKDWTKARVEEGTVTKILAATDPGGKVPYTNAGVLKFIGVCKAVHKVGLNAGSLTPELEILAPDVRTISSAQRSTRKLKTVTATFNLTGAINSAEYQINLIP